MHPAHYDLLVSSIILTMWGDSVTNTDHPLVAMSQNSY